MAVALPEILDQSSCKIKMLNFDWSDFLNEKSMAASEWPGRVRIHLFDFSKILNMEFPYLGDKISVH